jgi:hypothetical protein
MDYACSADRMRLLLRAYSMVCYVSLRLDSCIEERTNNAGTYFANASVLCVDMQTAVLLVAFEFSVSEDFGPVAEWRSGEGRDKV